MRIVHIVAAMEGVNGVSATVAFLSRMQRRMGDDVRVATLKSDGAHNTGNTEIIVFEPSFPRAVYFSWQMLTGLGRLVRAADVVWIHSSWTFPVWFGAFLAKRYGKKLVITPNGSFDPVRLKKSKRKKRLVSPIDRWCLRQAMFVQAACAAEVGWIKNFEPRVKAIREISLGVEVPENVSEPPEHNGLTLLYLGRIHYLKGIDLLVEAMRKLNSEDISLTIAGVDEENTLAGVGDISGLNIKVIPPVFGADKTALINEHDCLVLPSRTESYGIVVAEALAQARLVIVSTAAPWEVVKEYNCGWFVEPNVDEFVDAIKESSNTPVAVRKEMGLRGRKLVEDEFSWQAIAKEASL